MTLSRISYLDNKKLPELREKYRALTEAAHPLSHQLYVLYYERKNQEATLNFLTIQQTFLSTWQARGPHENEDALLAAYHQQLQEVVDNELLTYGDYLAARPGDALPLEEMKNRLKVLSEEFVLRKEDLLNCDVGVLLDEVTEEKRAETEAQYETTFESMTQANMDYEDIKADWDTFIKRKREEMDELVSRDPLALCERNDVARLKASLQGKGRSRKNKHNRWVNEQWPVLQHGAITMKTTALHLACYHGHQEMVAFLLAQGADPKLTDEEGYYPLHRLVSNPKVSEGALVATMDCLLNHCPTLLNACGPYGRRPLHTAAFFGHQAAIKALLTRKASVDVQETGAGKMTPLHCAVERGHTAIASLLLAGGARPHLRNAAGETAIQQAVYSYQRALMDQFMAHGYCPSTQDLAEIHTAISSGHCKKEALSLLKNLFEAQIAKLVDCDPSLALGEPHPSPEKPRTGIKRFF